jgi:hypothetical protein
MIHKLLSVKLNVHSAILLVSFLIGQRLHAGEMLRDVEWVRPRIAQRGTTVEVIIQGKFLEQPQDLIFYKPGIRSLSLETLPNLPNPIGLAHGGRIEEQVKAVLEIDPDCQPGEHPFRLRTNTGLSLLATFHVSPFPVEPETSEPNDTIATAQRVSLNTTILGKVDTDVFRVDASPGKRISIEVDCVRLADQHYGDAEFDLAIRALDSQGRELGSNDENALHVQDPLLSLIVPDSVSDHQVFIEVRQSVHSPRDIPYCIHIGDFLRPLSAYPAGGQAGKQLDVQLIGDPSGTAHDTLDVPTSLGTFPVYADAPSPLSLRSCPYGNILEDRNSEETNVPELPIALNGVIDEPYDTDKFRIHVKKGDKYRVRVYGSALGHPIDPAILIRKAPLTSELASQTSGSSSPSGNESIEVEADDADPRSLSDRDLFGSSIRSGGGFKDVLDPSVIWEPKSDGDYVLEIRDTSGNGSPSAVYRIEIESPPNSIHPVLTSRFFDWVEGSRGTGLASPKAIAGRSWYHSRKGRGLPILAPMN